MRPITMTEQQKAEKVSPRDQKLSERRTHLNSPVDAGLRQPPGEYDPPMKCAWLDCPNPASGVAPGLVNVSDKPPALDESVFLCEEHLAVYRDAEPFSPEMRDFMLGLQGEAAIAQPSTDFRRPGNADSLPLEPVIPSPPNDHGGFTGRDADQFDHAFRVCYDVSYRAVMADPPGSGPILYSAKRAVPIAAVGGVDPDSHEMAAVRAGCLAGQVTAFNDTAYLPPPGWP